MKSFFLVLVLVHFCPFLSFHIGSTTRTKTFRGRRRLNWGTSSPTFRVLRARDDYADGDERDDDSTFSLSYCSDVDMEEEEECLVALRETVQNNQSSYATPATGQVMLTHDTKAGLGRNGYKRKVVRRKGRKPSVLILLRQGDSSLISFLLAVLRKLEGMVTVYVETEVMATLTHDHDVLGRYEEGYVQSYVSRKLEVRRSEERSDDSILHSAITYNLLLVASLLAVWYPLLVHHTKLLWGCALRYRSGAPNATGGESEPSAGLGLHGGGRWTFDAR